MNPNTNPYKLSYTNNVISSSLNDISTRSLFTVSIGEESGKSATGTNNVFVGYRTGFNTLETHNSVFIGSHTGFNTTSGDGNVFIGARCATNVTNSSFNTIAGYNSAINMKSGEYNTVFGYDTISQSDTLSYNTVFGTSCGKNMDQSTYNVIIGTNTTNTMYFGDCNIYIGTHNEPIKPNSDNSLILGNFNTIDDDSITIGSMNSSSTKNCISIGTNIKSQSVSTITDPLTQYDPLILNTAKQRLNIDIIDVIPQNNNLIYTPISVLSPPYKLSTRNDVDITKETYTISTTQIDTSETSFTKTIVFSDNVNKDNLNILYNITLPVITINQTYSTSIPISSLPIDTAHNDIQILILKQPKYGYVNKIVYNLDETIVVNQYPEFRLFKNDRIQITTIQYGFISSNVFNIFITRDVTNVSIPTQFYNSYIHPRYFYETNEIMLLQDGTSINQPYYPTSNIFTLNGLELYSNTLPTYDHSIVDITYTITLLPSSITIYPTITNDIGIYIETPPVYGVISSNLYMSVNNFEYFIKDPSTTNDDNMLIRFIHNDMLSSKSYNVIIKNYVVYLDSIYLNEGNIEYPLTTSLETNGYFWEDKILKHKNRPFIHINENTQKINVPSYLYVNINNISISCICFNKVLLNEYLDNHINTDNYLIHVLSPPSNGYVKDNIYYNTRNVSDEFRIVITLNSYIGFEEHIVDVTVLIRNRFEITKSTQYITESTINDISTIHVNDIYNSNIQVYDKNLNYISKLDELIVFEEGTSEYYLVFGEVIPNVPIEIFPLINHNVRTDYYYEALIPNDVETVNTINYVFNNILNTDFEIEFILRVEPYLYIDDYNNFHFKFIIGSNVFIFKQNGIYISDIYIEYNFQYDTSYLIYVANSGIHINDVLVYENNIVNVDRIELEYNLNENIINTELLINYTVPLLITNLTIATSLDSDGQNVLIGRDMISSGIDNICIGKDFNTFGNNSVIIGNDIGSSEDLLFDNGIHDSIVIGNNNFQKSLAKNIISIGNNIYRDFEILNQKEYQDASIYFAQNPILIGNDLQYDNTHVINIGNKIVVTYDSNIILNGINIRHTLDTIQYQSSVQSNQMNEIINNINEKDIVLSNNLNHINQQFQDINNKINLFNDCDIKYKKDIYGMDVEESVNIIKTMRPVEFTWNGNSVNKRDIGFIAQELEELSEFIVNDTVDGCKYIKYEKIVPYMIKALQYLLEKVK